MAHPLVDQLRFTRFEWKRGLDGIPSEDGTRHLGPMNCTSWIVGHLAWQEQMYWLYRTGGNLLYPELNSDYSYGAPMSTPDMGVTLGIWQEVVQSTKNYLDSITSESLGQQLLLNGEVVGQTIGSAILRMTYHYWYHIGEIQAIRQMLGHDDLPEYVGHLDKMAPYRPE